LPKGRQFLCISINLTKDDKNNVGCYQSSNARSSYSTFMKIIKERTNKMSAANDERLQFLNPRVIWDRSIDRFEVFKNNVEVHYGQNLLRILI
jgi:hypothetical protein